MKKPNIVWIFCDELRNDALGCYGNPYARMRTPHIDSIAESGIRFNQCHCTSPVCVSSRTSVLTALYPEQTGVYHNEATWKTFHMEHRITFPELFSQNGYAVASFGKTHHNRVLQPWAAERHEGTGNFTAEIPAEELQVIHPPGLRTTIGGRFPGGRPFPPERLTDAAVDWLNGIQQPFFIRLSYVQPHTPVLPPPPYCDLYLNEKFPDAISMRDSPSAFERRFAEILRAAEMPGEHVRLAHAYYYGLVAWIDSQVGRVLDAVRERGEMENTIFIFDADHGASLGENGCYAKQLFARHSHRIPRLLSWRGTIPAAQVRDDICEGLDLARTLLGLAGLDTPAHFRGRNLVTGPAPDAIYSTIGFGAPDSMTFPLVRTGRWYNNRGWPRRSCIRTAQYRLDKNTRIDGQSAAGDDVDLFLCDVKADPAERENLARKPEYAGVLADLNARLDRHIAGAVETPDAWVTRNG